MANVTQRSNGLAHEGVQGGFTLVEIAFVVLISGLMAVIYTQSYFSYVESQRIARTEDSMDLSESALKEWLDLKKSYPCPADPRLPETHPNYGRADCSTTAIRVAGRDADGDATPDPILVGAIPFRTLLDENGDGNTSDGLRDIPLTASSSLDGWGNKLTYAITENLTKVATYRQTDGAIQIVDEFNLSVIDPPGSMHAIIISHGPNGRGAYSTSGVLSDSCGSPLPPTPPTPPLVVTMLTETENCNGDGVFLHGLKSLREASYNDDIVKYFAMREARLWIDYGAGRAANTNVGNVGVGTTTPQAKLDVNGTVGGLQITGRDFCDKSNVDATCMPLAALASNDPNMSCRAGASGIGAGNAKAIRSIQKNRVECETLFPTMPTGTCPTGRIAVGIQRSSLGVTLLCEPKP